MKNALIKNYIIQVGLFLFILFPTLMGTFMAIDLTSWSMRLIYLLSSLGFYAFLYVLLKQRTFFYVAAIFFLQGAIEVVHLVINHATMSLLFLWTIFASERREFIELFSMYWFIVVIIIALWILYIIIVKRNIPNEYKIASHRIRLWVASVILLLFLSVIILSLCQTATKKQFGKRFAHIECVDGIKKFTPINTYLLGYQLFSISDELKNQQDALERFTFNIPTNPEGDDLVVLVIGETSRYDHWQLNGYQRNTSPRLCARGEQLISFDSCYTIANLTTVCVPFMLTPATPEQPHRFYNEKSIVEAFSEAGYRTAWIADQSFGNTFLQRISNTCDFRYYTDNLPNMKDTLLIAPFISALQYTDKQLIVVHSLGCHFKYSSRYSNEFRTYRPDLSDIEVSKLLCNHAPLENFKQLLVNSYDNAISYTDFILDTLIQSVKDLNRSAVFVYIGDHGENLLDDERKMILHGTFQASQYETHVPLFVWISDTYKQRYPSVQEALKTNQNKVFSTMTLFNSLLDFGHIPYQDMDTTESIVRPSLISHPIIYGLDANLKLTEMEK
ncbi:MAG: phosphoethanolamine transferase [Paludibacteraceae bacterium]|nr:phosphoethanolamine transferase [Paludibacteraceae bacterium]